MTSEYDFHYWWNEDTEMITIVNYGEDYAARYQNFSKGGTHDIETKLLYEILEFSKQFIKNNFEDFLDRLIVCDRLSLEEHLYVRKLISIGRYQ